MNRRKFIQLGVVGAGATLAGIEPLSGQVVPVGPSPKSSGAIAIPISVAPLVKGDLDAMFDDMRTRAGVNALFIFIYTHETHRAGVEKPDDFHGGNYAGRTGNFTRTRR